MDNVGENERLTSVMSRKQIELSFPLITAEGYQIRSEETPQYNCIAWAVGDSDRWWWPVSFASGGYYWPEGVLKESSVNSFKDAFATIGYIQCETGDLEGGFEKIALYVDESGTTTHAARQLPSGAWTSKLGKLKDIEHVTLRALEQSIYGVAVYFFRKPRS
jgi:hypothetical protein